MHGIPGIMHGIPGITSKGCCISKFSMMLSLFVKYVVCLSYKLHLDSLVMRENVLSCMISVKITWNWTALQFQFLFRPRKQEIKCIILLTNYQKGCISAYMNCSEHAIHENARLKNFKLIYICIYFASSVEWQIDCLIKNLVSMLPFQLRLFCILCFQQQFDYLEQYFTTKLASLWRKSRSCSTS